MDREELDSLMTEVASGDNAAFERLYRKTSKGVYAMAYSYFGNREDAEDIMQSTYLQVKRKAYTYRPGSNAGAWLLTIVRNLSLDRIRKERRATTIPPEEWERQPAKSGQVGRSALDLLGSLPPEERKIVVLHVFWGYKHREIAQMLELPLGTVTWKYRVAVGKLEKSEEES